MYPLLSSALFSIAVADAVGLAASNWNGTQTTGTGPTGTGAPSTGTAPVGNPRTITAHPDGQCVKPVNNFNNNTFTIQNGFPNYTTIQTPAFPGAEASSGGGYDVWWAIPDPGPGCRNMIMIPYDQDRGTPGYPGGKEIINAGHAGCYFGNVPTDTNLLLSFCCGTGDCAASSLNSTSLLSSPTKRDVGSPLHQRRKESEAKRRKAAQEEQREQFKKLEQEPSQEEQEEEEKQQHSGSLAARAKGALTERFYYPPPPKDPGCTYNAGEPYSQAGQQVIVTSGEGCPDDPCSIAVSSQISFSTTAMSQTTQTLTSSEGLSIALKAGVDFLEDADVTTTFSTDFSDAVAKATGTSIMTGNSTTITNTIALKLGNMGAVSFTPVYKCWTGPVDCGKGASDPIAVCQPDFSGVDGSLKGEYNAVVYG